MSAGLAALRRRAGRDEGQASVELLGAIPAVLVTGLVIFQMLAVGYSAVLAGTAAEAGALALAAGADPKAGVREALPGWSRTRTKVTVDGGTVRVRLRPLTVFSALAERLAVSAEASVRS